MPPIASGKTIIYKSNCNLNPVATLLDLPLVGAENTLYIVKDTAAIYIWDGADYIVYDSRPYKSYVALVGQEDADDPTATVYENTTGYTVTWTRDQIGQYIGTFVGAPVDIDLLLMTPTFVDPITVIDSDPLFVYTDELSLLFAAWLLLHPEVEATFDDTDLVNGNITITDIFSDLIITIGYTYDGDPLETTDTVLMTESVGTCEDPLFVWVLSQDGNITRIDYISADPIVYGDGEANRIAYWQDTDTITSDTDLYWNSANNRLGIGTSAPTASIEISSDTSSSVILDMATNSSNRPLVSFKRSRGTIASKLAVIENDKLGSLTFSGSDGTNHNVSGGLVECFVDGAVSSNVVPARLSFVTGTSISNRYERLTVKADGNVGIGTTTPTIAKLEVNGATLTQHRVEANTDGVGSPNLITAQETRSIFTNEGTAALNYHTLPTAVAGLTYTFYVADIDGIRVVANTGDIIQINGIASSVAGYCESLVIGSSVTLTAINATDWVAISSLGTWNLA